MLDLLFDEVPCLLVQHGDPLVSRFGSKCSTGVIHLFHSFLFVSLNILADWANIAHLGLSSLY